LNGTTKIHLIEKNQTPDHPFEYQKCDWDGRFHSKY